MVDYVSVSVAKVNILLRGVIVNTFHHLLNDSIVHVNQKNPLLRNAAVVEIDVSAEGCYPVILKSRVINEDILYMGK